VFVTKLAKRKYFYLFQVIYWEKMSKSKYNGEDPGQVISKYGCDMTR